MPIELRPDWLWQALCALGIGLIIGLEREHARVQPDGTEGEDLQKKGARTFSLITLFGYGAAVAGERYPGLPICALAVLVVLLSVLHLRDGEDVTTEIAALFAAVLGMLVRTQMQTAVVLGLLCVLILVAKPWVRGFIKKLRRRELIGTLQLLVALLIVLPVVPSRELSLPLGLNGLLNPRSVVLFVVLIAGIGYVGYVLVRVLGPGRGLALTGMVGGLTSSTAVTLAMGERARLTPGLTAAAALSTVLASGIMGPRVLLVCFVAYPPLAGRLLWPLVAMGSGYLLAAGLMMYQQRRHSPPDSAQTPDLALENPFELVPALKFGLLYVAVLLCSRVAHRYLGAHGLYLAAMLAGLGDVDVVTLTATRLAREGLEPLTVCAATVAVAIASNTVVKTVLAFTSGGRAYGRRVLSGHAGALLIGGAVLAWVWLRG